MILGTGVTILDIIFGVAFLFVVWLVTYTGKIRKGLRYPPGPPGKLLSGNASDMPTRHEWVTYNRWATQYGDLVHVTVYGKSMIFVNSLDVAQDLFEKRSSIYSDRFNSPMVMDLMGWGYNIGLMRYGEWWRRHRRAFHQYFHPKAAAAFRPIQTRQTRNFLRKLHDSPVDFLEHIRFLSGAIIMEVVYGIQVRPKDDPYIETAEKAMSALAEAAIPGAFLVDSFPILKHVPEWMPGAEFQRKARAWKIPTVEMCMGPWMAVKEAIGAGTAKPSLMVTMLDDLSHKTDGSADPESLADEEAVIRNVGANAYGAGSDTTVAALRTFILAMVLYPEVQRKAHAELNSVIGVNRLPEYEDRDMLPYINALCKEIHRFHPALPLAVPHRVLQDDVYGDYFIPGGSVVVGNSWSILHDEKVYGLKPEEFEPERFLKPGVPDPTAQFGFGRRICAGRYMADNSIFIAVASILHVFEIEHTRDENGVKIPVEPSFTSGLISHPEPFQCSIKPRSASVERLLERNED